MAQILCLANSYKGGGGRCVAGIDMCTKEWVRPFNPRGHEGAIGNERLINGNEPKILDVLEIPIGGESENYGCQPENRILFPGKWKKIGTISPEDALEYIEEDIFLLHNDDKKVDIEFFESVPKEQWKSLQLIRSGNVKFNRDEYDNRKWRVCFSYGRNYLDLKLTDVVLSGRLRNNEKISSECMLTVSLATPWKRDDKTPERCYKMIAGVIEL